MNTIIKRLNTYYRKTTRVVTARNVAHVIEGKFGCDNNSNTVTTVLPFDVEDMKLLVTAYDGYVQLLDEIERIFEVRPAGGCFSDLEALKELLKDLSPIYVDGASWDNQELGLILADNTLSLDEAATRIMGGTDA